MTKAQTRPKWVVWIERCTPQTMAVWSPMSERTRHRRADRFTL